MQVTVYNQEGQQVSTLELSDAVFGVKVNKAVVHQAVVAQQSNARATIGHTKTRGEVRGGGRKPWKQKGTGRARHGSIRSPIWRGGGITFGPRPERNFSLKLNSKTRRQAILMALSDKIVDKNIIILESLKLNEQKTKAIVAVLKALPLKRGKTMLALPKEAKSISKLVANVDRVTPMWVGSLNIVDLLKHTNMITTVKGAREIEEIYKPK